MIRARLAGLTSRWVFAKPHRAARLLSQFARAEKNSELELRLAGRRTSSAALRALFVRHAVDEARHARLFHQWENAARAAAGLSPASPLIASFEALAETLGEAPFIAFVHLGERRGMRQFEAIAESLRQLGDAQGEAVIRAVLVDERRHTRSSLRVLRAMAGNRAATVRALRAAARWEAWRGWRRFGRAAAQALYAVLCSALYLLSFPVGLALRHRRRPPPGWSPGTEP